MRIITLMIAVALTVMAPISKEAEYISYETLNSYTEEIGDMYDIDPYLLIAVCEAESSRNINACNGNCVGLMQISTKWHKERMDKLGVEDLYDPYSNILVSADYLAELFEINDDPYYVLMRYNMKASTAEKLYKEGKISQYAKNIVSRAQELKSE